MGRLLDVIDANDGDVRGFTFCDENLSGLDLGHVEFEDCNFEACSFADARADRISFDRCAFVGCDLSNARLTLSYWRDCNLRESRLVGCDLHHSYLVRTRMDACACSYVNLAESKAEQLALTSCDLREASLSQIRAKRLTIDGCDLTRAELFMTRLRGVDLSGSVIEAIRLSDTYGELRGAKIALEQAPDIVSLLGVKVV